MNKPSNVVLLIDDEPKIRRFLRAGFELDGFTVLEAENAAEALRVATFSPPDLIILDLALPDLHGTEVLERIRSWSNVPVIILSVVSAEGEKVRLLQSGADDYVVKPFGMAELLARAEAALRRYFKSATENPVVTAGPLSVDLVSRTVSLNSHRISLTRKEYRLLHILAMHVGLVVTHDQLLKEIWIESKRDNIQYLRILVRKLRQKIETDPNDPRLLVTESGVGYRLQNRLEIHPVGQVALRPSPRRSFYIAVFRSVDHSEAWCWEIRRKRKPMGVRLWQGGFRSHRAALSAGKAALEDFLNGLAMDAGSPVRDPADVC